MVKFTTQKDGKILLGLGLSEKNLECLREGKPIVVDGALMSPELSGVEVLIFYGKTETAIYQDLKQHGVEIKHEYHDLKAHRPT